MWQLINFQVNWITIGCLICVISLWQKHLDSMNLKISFNFPRVSNVSFIHKTNDICIDLLLMLANSFCFWSCITNSGLLNISSYKPCHFVDFPPKFKPFMLPKSIYLYVRKEVGVRFSLWKKKDIIYLNSYSFDLKLCTNNVGKQTHKLTYMYMYCIGCKML